MPRIERIDQSEEGMARQIHDLLRLTHAQEAELLGLQAGASTARSVEDIRLSDQFFLGAFEDGALVGATSVGADDESNQISITSLSVVPAYQRQGIGRMLVSNALSHGAAMAFSVSAAANNAPALALYRSLGFVEYRRGTLGPEQIAMVKLRRPAQSPLAATSQTVS